MNVNINGLIARYRDKGILIDTNLLLVLLVGNIDLRLIGRVGRTERYSRGTMSESGMFSSFSTASSFSRRF